MTTLQERPRTVHGAAATKPARRPVTFVSWGAVAGRPAEIAQALGGESRCFFPKGSARRPGLALRYLLSAAGTAWHLARRRPQVVLVTNPPVPGAWFTAACARAIGAAIVVDSHPGGFGAQGDRVAAKLQWLHRRLVRRAAAVIVTDDTWCAQVRAWGGRPLVVHEAPVALDAVALDALALDAVAGRDAVEPGDAGDAPVRSPGERLSVLVVGNFHRDEPVDAVVEAARQLPGCDFLVTGEPARCPPELRAALPPNVQLVGFLDPARYQAALAACDAVVTLTTEPTSVMRAAYEAVYARRPVVVSDWPVGRRLFPHAVHTSNDAEGLVAAIEALRADYRSVAARVDTALAEQLARWEAQLGALVCVVDASLRRPTGTGPRPAVALDPLDGGAAVRRIVSDAARGHGGRVANVNLDILRLALADPGLRQSINGCDLVLADGVPIVWATRLQGTPVPERVAASEMIWPVCEEAARRGVGVFLLGGALGTARRAAQRLAERSPGLRIDHLCPPMGFERDDAALEAVVRVLDEVRPGIVFCGFGAPKQERLMEYLARRFPSMWFVACGGTFAMVSGDLPPAPEWMRAHALEWVHRLRLEPRRLFGRYVVRDLPFAPRVLARSAAARLGRRRGGVLRVRHAQAADALEPDALEPDALEPDALEPDAQAPFRRITTVKLPSRNASRG